MIRGNGKFLIPGLWDAHVHLSKTGVLSLPLFIANGITGVRDMGSNFEEIAAWRTEIKNGKLFGPRIKTSGPILESQANVDRMKREGTVEPVDKIRFGVSNPEGGRAAVKLLAEKGVDHIKMRSTPDLATFLAVADEAKRHHLPLTAHPLFSPEVLLQAGLSSVEHFIAYPPLNNLTDTQRRALFQQMAKSGMYISDTEVNLRALLATPYAQGKKMVEDAAGTLDGRRKYVCGYLVKDWREQVEETKDAPYDELRKELPQMRRDLREMREQGVPFLAGTDAAVLFMYPGFSLHDELALLVQELAFSPMEVLRIATSGIASFYGETNRYGSIEPNQLADLVLLDANPLTDIRNTKRIGGVLTSGRWLDRAELNKILQRIQQQASAGCTGFVGPS